MQAFSLGYCGTPAWASTLGTNTRHSCSTSRANLLSGCSKKSPKTQERKKGRKKKKEITSKNLIDKRSTPEMDSLLLPAPASFVHLPLQWSVLIFLLCLTVESFLPHYAREETAILYMLPVVRNKFDTTFQAAPTYCLVSRPPLQTQMSRCHVTGFIRQSKSQPRGIFALEHLILECLATALRRNIYFMLLVLYYCMFSSFCLASGCWRIYNVLPSCDTYGFLPSLLCCPWLYALPVNSMYQKLQVFCRKKENYNYKTKMVAYQRWETGLWEIVFHQLCCKECFYTCIRVVDFIATSYYSQRNK